MKISMNWQGDMTFVGTDGRNSVTMDTQAPIGRGAALSPKQMCLASICGCTGIDVASLLKKYKQTVRTFRMEADAPTTEGYPSVFAHVQLDFFLEGEIESAKAIEAVELSQTKYCGVSAMIAKACPIHYRVHVNGTKVHEGQANFPA